jgi:hypothetical protein
VGFGIYDLGKDFINPAFLTEPLRKLTTVNMSNVFFVPDIYFEGITVNGTEVDCSVVIPDGKTLYVAKGTYVEKLGL